MTSLYGIPLMFQPCRATPYFVEKLITKSFNDIDITLFNIRGIVYKQSSLVKMEKGKIVVDNNLAFQDVNVPLVIPELNLDNTKATNFKRFPTIIDNLFKFLTISFFNRYFLSLSLSRSLALTIQFFSLVFQLWHIIFYGFSSPFFFSSIPLKMFEKKCLN